MHRFLEMSAEMVVGDSEIVFELDPEQVKLIALEITLLLQELAASLALHFPNGRVSLSVAQKESLKRATFRENGSGFEVILSKNQAEYLQSVLLRAYRDGMAEVNHVHLEGMLDKRSFDLTVLFSNFRPPMASEEARRLLR